MTGFLGDYSLHENCWVEFQTGSLSSWWRIFRLDWYCAHQKGTEPQTQENLWRFKLSTQNCRSWGFSLLDCRGIEAFKRDGFRQAEQTNFQQASHHRSRNKTIRWKSLIPHHEREISGDNKEEEQRRPGGASRQLLTTTLIKSSVNDTRRDYSDSLFHRGQRVVRIRINTRTYFRRGISRRQARKGEGSSHMRTTISRNKCKVSQMLSITFEDLLKDRIFFLWFSNLEYFSVFFLPSFQKGIFAPRAPCLHNLSLIYFSFPKMLHKYKASRMRITVRKIVHLALLRASDVDGQNVTRQWAIWNNFRIDWILEGTSW